MISLWPDFADLNKPDRRWLTHNLQVKSIKEMVEMSLQKFFQKMGIHPWHMNPNLRIISPRGGAAR